MFWVLQNNVFKEDGYLKLLMCLDHFNIPNETVNMFQGDISPDINPEGLVMCCGGLGIHKVSKRKGWYPGSFLNENFDFKVWSKNWGKELFNYNSDICSFKEVSDCFREFDSNELFIRPVHDSKSINGKVYSLFEYNELLDRLYRGGSGIYTSLTLDTEMVVALPDQIFQEFRFFILDGQILTASQYKQNNKAYQSVLIDKDVSEYCQKMVDKWQPARAFVIDIWRGYDGLKIGEVNNFNSSGLYYCDVQKIVMGIENAKW